METIREMILSEERHEKVVTFLAEACEDLTIEKLSDRQKFNQAMSCLQYLTDIENTQYDEAFHGISILLSAEQMEEIICCLIDFIPFEIKERR